jgi:predicted porin
MKKAKATFLTGGIMAFVAVTAIPVHAQEDERPASSGNGTTIYGRIDLSVDKVTAGKNSNVGYGVPGATVVRMTDNTSRLGFAGVEDLGGGSAALYGLELGINANNGTLVSPNFRYSYVGLTGNWGTFNMGRLDSSVPTGSPLYSQLARNLRWIIHDAGATAIGTRVLNGNNRVSNAMTYKSPTFSGFNLSARMNLAGPDVGTTSSNANLKGEADFKQYQIAMDYVNGRFSGGFGVASDSKKGGFLINDYKGKTQGVITYDFSTIRPFLAVGQDKYSATTTTRETVNFWLAGATAPLGQGRVTLNYMNRDVQTDKAGVLKKLQAEYSHLLSKRSTLYVYMDRDTTNSNKVDSIANTVGVGILHKF